MKKNHILVIILIVVAAALVALISGHFKKAVCESNPDSEVFGIYTATLAGKNMKPLITTSWQQMTHARVSPDKKWVTFTRYTNRGKDGCATENQNNYDRKGQQYLGTEVMIMRIDGTDVRTLIPHQKDKMAANSYWTPDGKGIIYVSSPNENGRPQINHIILDDNMQVKEITKLPIPDHIIPADPHWVGEWVVFPAMDIKNRKRGIWRMRYDGSGLELLAQTPKKAEMQDNDPKLSPDTSQVAFMRKMKEGLFWHSLVVDVETKEIKDLSEGFLPKKAKVAIEAVPSWSSDGELLIFDHIVVHNLRFVNEIHTMKPDGSQRRRIPLAEKYGYFHPSFFPGEGSGKDARIMFSARKMRSLGKKQSRPETAVRGSYEEDAVIGEIAKNGTDCNKEFGLYVSTLDGKNIKQLITDSYRQMTHARVSPNKQWIAFTRYNNIGKDGCAVPSPGNYATEGEGYEKTEILLMRLDGSDLRVVVPAQKGKAAANSYWTPDGKGLVYMHSDGKKVHTHHIIFNENMEIDSETEIPLPDYLGAVDPYWGKDSSGNDRIVFPAHNRQTGKKGLWWVRTDGSDLEQLTFPELRDNDPKISPDGSKIAFMRQVKEGIHYHNIILDLKTRKETDLSEGYFPENIIAGADLMPEWSSDGELLIFWQIYLSRQKQLNELHVIKPDGTGRKAIPLHKEFDPGMVAFFPGEGSDENTRIIFSTTKKKTNKYPFEINLSKPTAEQKSTNYEKINIIGEVNTNGIFDPSVEYNEDGSMGWMTYSSIDAPKYIRTNLAKTLDHGKTWTFVKTINSSVDGRVRLKNKTINGSWWNEVSTLVHDPDDPGREWKLFWHKYFAKHDPGAGAANRVLQYGWIAYKYSSDPAGKWSEEIPLFGAGPFPLKPHKTRINLSELHPDLKGLFVYTEPGSIYKNGVLYLSLQGHKFVNKQNIAKIILIASYDHGKTWRYMGTLLENEDAQRFGAYYFSGSSLVEEKGRIFLLAAPQDPGRTMAESSTKGTAIFEFEDIKKGKLKEDNEGNLIDVKWIKTTTNLKGGQSDYDEQNTYGGIIMPQINFAAFPESFQIFNTKEKIIP